MITDDATTPAPLDTLVLRLAPPQRRAWAAACVRHNLPLCRDWPAVRAWLEHSLLAVAAVVERDTFTPALALHHQAGGRLFTSVMRDGPAPVAVYRTIQAMRRVLVVDPTFAPVWALDAADQAALAHPATDQAAVRQWQRDEAIRTYYRLQPIPLRRRKDR